MRKKVLAMILSAAMALTTNVGTVWAAGDKFTDINGHWGQTIINEAAEKGVVGGYPEGYYLPDNLMKREEFYKLITNVLTQMPDTSSAVLSFKDMDPIEWYIPTIKIAVAAGIAKGYEDGTFGVGQMISRQEAAKVVASVISTDKLDTSKNASSVKDAALIGDWALPYVNIMFQKGYMQGDDQGNFRPTMALTRAEAATLLLNVKNNEAVIKGPGNAGTGNSGVGTSDPAVPAGTAGCQTTHLVTAGAFTLGNGTVKDPYQISTAAQLNHMRKHMSEGRAYILTKDIKIDQDFAAVGPGAGSGLPDWSQGNFEPIGSEDNPFIGQFDGQGHIISGLEIMGAVTGKADTGNIAGNAGLFGYVDTKSSIENVTIEKSSITGAVNVGGIAGYNKGSIANCVLGEGSTVTGQTNIGGVAGYSAQLMKSNINKGKVEGTVNTGGIVGSIDLEGEALYGCVNKGSVAGKSRTGGIVGYVPASTASMTMESCSNAGQVSSTASYAGGVAGQIDGTTYGVYVTDCYNTGTLAGDGSNGGIVGYARESRSKISDCYNTGTVNGKNAGGIVGSNEGNVEKCYNKGQISADSEAGGIVAYQNTGEGRIQACYNMGKVIANSNAGGIAGLSRDRIVNVYNSGTVKATNTAGGLVGSNYAAIQRAYNVGLVDGVNGSGALVGRNQEKLTNCFWLLGTCDDGIGYEDSGSVKSIVMVLSKEQLSGQKKVKLGNGYQLLTSYLNDKAGDKVWSYTYRTDQAASAESRDIISDGGGVVPPLSISTTEDGGNIINGADLQSAYLYPELTEVQR